MDENESVNVCGREVEEILDFVDDMSDDEVVDVWKRSGRFIRFLVTI